MEKNKIKIQMPKLRLRYRLFLYFVILLFATLSLISVATSYFPNAVEIAFYVLAACTLFVGCYYLIFDISHGIKGVMYEVIKQKIVANPYVSKVAADDRLRTIVFVVPGFTIYAAAAYTFYKIINSTIKIVKEGKRKSPLLMIIRKIGYIDACVSILTLQTAMFATFAQGEEIFMKVMNVITGTAVFLLVLGMGIQGICSSGKLREELIEKQERA